MWVSVGVWVVVGRRRVRIPSASSFVMTRYGRFVWCCLRLLSSARGRMG